MGRQAVLMILYPAEFFSVQCCRPAWRGYDRYLPLSRYSSVTLPSGVKPALCATGPSFIAQACAWSVAVAPFNAIVLRKRKRSFPNCWRRRAPRPARNYHAVGELNSHVRRFPRPQSRSKNVQNCVTSLTVRLRVLGYPRQSPISGKGSHHAIWNCRHAVDCGPAVVGYIQGPRDAEPHL